MSKTQSKFFKLIKESFKFEIEDVFSNHNGQVHGICVHVLDSKFFDDETYFVEITEEEFKAAKNKPFN